MADLSKMSDLEVIRHTLKLDEKSAQNLLDKGMNVDVLRGKVDPFKEVFSDKIADATAGLKDKLQEITDEFNLK